MQVQVLPDEIRFSQDNINNKFASFKGKLLGEVLDDICDKKMSLKDFLKNMKVGRWQNQQDKWYTVNNRSLWVLKQLRLNNVIPSNKKITFGVNDIEPWRFTTKNDGESIVVRQKPVGGRMARPAPFWRYRKETWEGRPANTVEFRYGRPLMQAGAGGSDLYDYESDVDSDDEYEWDDYFE